MKKKVQVVVLAQEKKELWVLLLKTLPTRGSFWQNVTGSVDRNEDFGETAQRELEEETGIAKPVINLNHTFYFWRDDKEIQEAVFLVVLPEKRNMVLDQGEHSEYQWKRAEEIQKTHYGFESNYEAFLKAIHYVETH